MPSEQRRSVQRGVLSRVGRLPLELCLRPRPLPPSPQCLPFYPSWSGVGRWELVCFLIPNPGSWLHFLIIWHLSPSLKWPFPSPASVPRLPLLTYGFSLSCSPSSVLHTIAYALQCTWVTSTSVVGSGLAPTPCLPNPLTVFWTLLSDCLSPVVLSSLGGGGCSRQNCSLFCIQIQEPTCLRLTPDSDTWLLCA